MRQLYKSDKVEIANIFLSLLSLFKQPFVLSYTRDLEYRFNYYLEINNKKIAINPTRSLLLTEI